MDVFLTKNYGFNPGFGMQTANVEGGTETIFYRNLGNPVRMMKNNVAPPEVDYADGDILLLLNTKTTNRITRFNVRNVSSVPALASFFIAYYADGKLVFPTYVDGSPCYHSLFCQPIKDDTAAGAVTLSPVNILANSFTSCMNSLKPWNGGGAIAAGAGGIVAYGNRASAAPGNANSATAIFYYPSNYPNIGALMDATLRGNGNLATNGLKDFSAIDTDVCICMKLSGNLLTATNANLIDIEIGIIETDISARNETEEYVKSWNQVAAGDVYATNDGCKLNYPPKNS